ncbi:AAA family ATPase, partial [Flavobacteriaceae bacterium]|nr:AAA family ATPase [Flavobacteriaceae bacterium]
MHLKQITLTNYKNITSKTFDFNPKINCFIGNNGVGKTNILDAIYHLAFGKSYFNPISIQNIQIGTDFFALEGRYETNEREEKIICSVKKGQKKTLKRNGKIYDRIADHIGLIPTVIISPADRDLISEGSSTRRKFIDAVIGQTDAEFLRNLI